MSRSDALKMRWRACALRQVQWVLSQTLASGRRSPWIHSPMRLIKAAKASLACWNVDTQAIWDQFVAFNQARGNTAVPAGFLLGFMRRWQTSRGVAGSPQKEAAPARDIGPTDKELLRLIAVAPSRNREFPASDLRRVIGNDAYCDRVLNVVRQF